MYNSTCSFGPSIFAMSSGVSSKFSAASKEAVGYLLCETCMLRGPATFLRGRSPQGLIW